MAPRYSGRCGVAGCAWHFSSPSPALITELYGNHFRKAHTGSATLVIEPGWLVIPWPSDNQELVRLNLAEAPEHSRARAAKRLLISTFASFGAAVGMLLTAVLMTANPSFAPGVRVLGGGPFWIGFFVPDLAFTLGAVICFLRVRQSSVSPSFRRLGFVFLIVTSVGSVLFVGLLWLGIIAIADLSLTGQVPPSFNSLYFLQIVLAMLSAVGLLSSVALFRNAAWTDGESRQDGSVPRGSDVR
jgi:hypothetical protein